MGLKDSCHFTNPGVNAWAVRLRAREVREVQVLSRHTLSGL